METDKHHALRLFEALADAPETTQADLAAQVGVAVGTVNWYLKRWTTKGYVKIRRIGRWRWRYLLTPDGLAEKARLAREYVDASLALYRRTRDEARRLLGEVREAGYRRVGIEGAGDVAEICALTCLELGLRVVEPAERDGLPVLEIRGTELALRWPRARGGRGRRAADVGTGA